MTILDIVYVPDKRLRQKANTIKDFAPDLKQHIVFKQLVADMLETMRCHEGVGLAGPQIGVMQRIFVARIPLPSDDAVQAHPQAGVPFALLNPEISRMSPNLVEGQEGCLSIPGWMGCVDRPEWIEVQAQDVTGRPQKLRAEGFLARIFMHEIDHLNGVLYTDHINDREKLWVVEEDSNEEDR